MGEIRGIALFQRGKDRINYTKKALLYQDILRYSITEKEEQRSDGSFRIWFLAKWLLRHNQNYINYYKDPSTSHINKSSRVEYILNNIKGKLDDLVSLGMMVQSGTAKAAKGTGQVALYKYTDFGYLIAWLIEGNNPVKKERANDEIYKLFTLPFQNDTSPSAIFSSIFFKKCKDNNVFGDHVGRLREVLYSNRDLKPQREFFTQLKYVPHKNMENGKRTMHLWNEALNELELSAKQQYMHSLKVEIEKNMEMVVRNHRSFERIRYELKSAQDMVAVEALCVMCELYWPVGVNLVEYMERKELASREYITAVCPGCDIRSLIIPSV
jgi:hypothetical protein